MIGQLFGGKKMIKIDGIEYENVSWKNNSFEQTADILNGNNAGRLQNTGDMFLDPIGTFFNNTGTIMRNPECSDKEWDELFIILSNPLSEHLVLVPFNQGYLETKIYVSQIKRKLINQKNQKNKWQSTYTVTFTAMESHWLAGGYLQGYVEE